VESSERDPVVETAHVKGIVNTTDNADISCLSVDQHKCGMVVKNGILYHND